MVVEDTVEGTIHSVIDIVHHCLFVGLIGDQRNTGKYLSRAGLIIAVIFSRRGEECHFTMPSTKRHS